MRSLKISNAYSRYRKLAKHYFWVVTLTLVLTLSVIMLGAYTRLTDAGLGCPDWPGCYGKLVLNNNSTTLEKAQQNFPNQPIVISKAWTEMAHRYLAGTLGLLISILAAWSLLRKRKHPEQSVWLPISLVAAVIFQVVLGMWTVTLKVLPLVVMAHLAGGMLIACLLCLLMLSSSQRTIRQPHFYVLRPFAILGLIIVVLQILLGAWTSTNYAALACPTFPFCHGALFPTLDWKTAFNLMSPIGPNYEGGRLALNARVTIQMVHRYGAFVTVAFWLPFSLYLATSKTAGVLRKYGWIILALLILQFVLGAINVIKLLPIKIAISHNAVATLILMTVTAFIYQLYDNKPGST